MPTNTACVKGNKETLRNKLESAVGEVSEKATFRRSDKCSSLKSRGWATASVLQLGCGLQGRYKT